MCLKLRLKLGSSSGQRLSSVPGSSSTLLQYIGEGSVRGISNLGHCVRHPSIEEVLTLRNGVGRSSGVGVGWGGGGGEGGGVGVGWVWGVVGVVGFDLGVEGGHLRHAQFDFGVVVAALLLRLSY